MGLGVCELGAVGGVHLRGVELVDRPFGIEQGVPGAGEGKPELARLGPESEGGRGLVLIDDLAAAWAVVPRPVCGEFVIAGLSLTQGE